LLLSYEKDKISSSLEFLLRLYTKEIDITNLDKNFSDNIV